MDKKRNIFFTNIINSYQKFSRNYLEDRALLKVMRIYLTESCNANCAHCFNKDIRDESHMQYESAKQLLGYLKDNYVSKLKIMGGEPTVHPNFTELYELAQSNFGAVSLFTNALNDQIFSIKPREMDSIVYNFVFINKKFNFEKLLPLQGNSFPRVFEIVIDSTTDVQLLTDRIDFTEEECKKIGVKRKAYQLTMNCINNVFDTKKQFNYNFRYVLSFLLNKYPRYLSFDHTVPLCFWEDETLDLMEKNKISYYKVTCRGKDLGLIDSKFNLLHCNQYPTVITSIQKNGCFIPIKEIYKLLIEANNNKKQINYNKLCSSCEHYDIRCTGGCMIHKKFVIK